MELFSRTKSGALSSRSFRPEVVHFDRPATQVLGECGRYEEATALLGDSFRARSVWNPVFIHDNCLGHFAATLAEAKVGPLAWAFFVEIKSRKVWLTTFRTLCSQLSDSNSETKNRFLNLAAPALRGLCEGEDILSEKLVKGARLRSYYDVGLVEGISHAAVSIVALGKLSLAREFVLAARHSIDPKIDSYEWKAFLSAAIQTQCADIALEFIQEALVFAATLHGTVAREERIRPANCIYR